MDGLLIAEPLFYLIAVLALSFAVPLPQAAAPRHGCRVEAMTGDARPGRR